MPIDKRSRPPTTDVTAGVMGRRRPRAIEPYSDTTISARSRTDGANADCSAGLGSPSTDDVAAGLTVRLPLIAQPG